MRRRRGRDVDIPQTGRGAAAAATWIFHGDGAPRPGCGSVETGARLRYLARNSTYWPDVVMATTTTLWAVRLYWREPAFHVALLVSAGFFCLALYRNHVCRCPSWVLCHVGWHLLPLELYVGLMPKGRDHYVAWAFACLLGVLHLGDWNLLGGAPPKRRCASCSRNPTTGF